MKFVRSNFRKIVFFIVLIYTIFALANTPPYSLFLDILFRATVPLLLIFIVIVSASPRHIYWTWLIFTLSWIPVSVIVCYLLPDEGGLGLHVSAGDIFFIMMPYIYFLLSLLVIIVAYLVKLVLKKGTQSIK